MGARYDNIGGVQHKVSKRYDNINGVFRPVSKRFSNIAGVWRQGYSGAVARVHVTKNLLDQTYMNEDGSGCLGADSTYYDNDPANYTVSMDFYFDEAVAIAKNDIVFQLSNITIDNQTTQNSASIYVYGFSGNQYQLGYILQSTTPSGLASPLKSGLTLTTDHIKVQFIAKLTATSSKSSHYHVYFPSGGMTVAGKVINSVEII